MIFLLVALVQGASCDDPAVRTTWPEATREAACDLLARPTPNVSTDRAQLAAIYAQPDLGNIRHPRTSPFKLAYDRFQEWLFSLFESSGAQQYSNVTRVAVLFAAAVVSLWVVLRVVNRKRRVAAVEQASAQATAASPLQLSDANVHLANAERALTSSPREALRETLFALLSFLEKHRLARPDRVKTNRELSAELPTRGASAELSVNIEAALRWYDVAFYSLKPVSTDDAKAFLQKVRSLTSTAPGAPRA